MVGNSPEDQMTNKRTLSQHPDVTTACARRPETTHSKKEPPGPAQTERVTPQGPSCFKLASD